MSKDSKLYAFLGVLLIVIGFIIVYATQKKDKYAMFYAKQGLALFFVLIIASLFELMPQLSIGFISINRLISIVTGILWTVAWVIGMIYALSGEQKEIPLIGQFAKMIKI